MINVNRIKQDQMRGAKDSAGRDASCLGKYYLALSAGNSFLSFSPHANAQHAGIIGVGPTVQIKLPGLHVSRMNGSGGCFSLQAISDAPCFRLVGLGIRKTVESREEVFSPPFRFSPSLTSIARQGWAYFIIFIKAPSALAISLSLA
jgi:hypothetical protein